MSQGVFNFEFYVYKNLIWRSVSNWVFFIESIYLSFVWNLVYYVNVSEYLIVELFSTITKFIHAPRMVNIYFISLNIYYFNPYKLIEYSSK